MGKIYYKLMLSSFLKLSVVLLCIVIETQQSLCPKDDLSDQFSRISLQTPCLVVYPQKNRA